MPEAFQAGDTVELRSGSVPMTVEAVQTDGKITVRWCLDKPELIGGNLVYFMRAEGIPDTCFTKVGTPKLKVRK